MTGCSLLQTSQHQVLLYHPTPMGQKWAAAPDCKISTASLALSHLHSQPSHATWPMYTAHSHGSTTNYQHTAASPFLNDSQPLHTHTHQRPHPHKTAARCSSLDKACYDALVHVNRAVVPQCQVDGVTRPGIDVHANTGCGVDSDNQGVEHGVLAVRDERALHPAPERLEEVGSRVVRSWPAQTTTRLSLCDPSDDSC